jgi:prevent-host-death family protein
MYKPPNPRLASVRAREPIRAVSATEAKNQFADVLESAIEHGAVVITKHEEPKAVLLSIRDYNALVADDTSKLDTLTAQFDQLLARMQAEPARDAMMAAFDASPAQLGKAAIRTKKRG